MAAGTRHGRIYAGNPAGAHAGQCRRKHAGRRLISATDYRTSRCCRRVGGGNASSMAAKSAALNTISAAARLARTWPRSPAFGMAITSSRRIAQASATAAASLSCRRPISVKTGCPISPPVAAVNRPSAACSAPPFQPRYQIRYRAVRDCKAADWSDSYRPRRRSHHGALRHRNY